MRELHDKLNRGALAFDEPWPYMPHLTIAKVDTAEQATKVLEVSRLRWHDYGQTRTVRIETLTLVKGSGERWVDLAATPLGGVSLTSR